MLLRARTRTIVAATALAAANLLHSQQPTVTPLGPEATQWFAHLQYLASDDLKGRLIGTPGYLQAVEYVSQQYKQAGLKPAGTQGYLQPVPFDTVQVDVAASSLTAKHAGQTTFFKIGSEAILSTHADADTSVDASAVFAGFGLSTPMRHIDDLSGLDLHGKIAVVLAGSPPALHGPLKAYYRSVGERWKGLKAAGAVGVITISEPPRAENAPKAQAVAARETAQRPSYLVTDAEFDQIPGAKVSATLTSAAGAPLFAGAPNSLAELQALSAAGKPLPKFPLELTLHATTAVKRLNHFDAPNLLGILEGSDRKLKASTSSSALTSTTLVSDDP